MYAFFIHFFSDSVESEYTINRIRRELNCVGLDEFHFQSTTNYQGEGWIDKSESEIKGSDFVVFLYSSKCDNYPNRYSNVEKELDLVKKYKKLLFFIPMDPDNSEYRGHLEHPDDLLPHIDRFNGKDVDSIVIGLDDFIDYIKSADDNSTSCLTPDLQNTDTCVKKLEESLGIQSKNNISAFYNKTQVESAVRKKINESMVNQKNLNQVSLVRQYETMFNSIENLDERRQTNNTVYTTINTAMLALIAASLSLIMANIDNLAGLVLTFAMFIVLPFIGTKICSSWESSLSRYKNLRRGKFKTLEFIESYLPLNINRAEWEVLKSSDYVTASEDAKLPSQLKTLHYGMMIIGVILMSLSILLMNGVVSID